MSPYIFPFKMSNIALITNSAWSTYNFRTNLARKIKNSGHNIVLLFPFDETYTPKLEREFKCFDIPINAKGVSLFEEISNFIGLYKVFKKINIEILLTFSVKPNIYGSVLGRYFEYKVINNISGLGTSFLSGIFLELLVSLSYRFALRKSHKILFQNSNDLNLFISNHIVNKKNAELIPGSGVDLEKFKPSCDTEKHAPNKTFTFLFIGRIIKDKGFLEFVEAIKLIKYKFPDKKAEFLVLGELSPSNRSSISKDVFLGWEKEGLYRYLGFSDNVKEYIDLCDCLILPSYREGLPRVILEAFAMEKPAIATNVPGCNSIVDHGIDGLICEPRSSEDLSSKINTMLNYSNKEIKLMGKRARIKVEKNYSEELVLKKYLSLINDI